ncbi:hypothetical protein BCR34DRAFT_6290 [Clohesyomyces aquaticus]|uniref:ATP-dependent DNA helicase n=1 Tax=Clohesyomyces aquaticus TaxID=1231657 RepID=A0A1Y2ABF5_9PLEO|nr:hypothetical protein BCR34DRAFT_6290 [Clohesyomyces aquaticus]
MSLHPYDLDFLRSHGYPTLPTVSSATYVSRHWNSAAPLSDLAGPAVEHPIPYAGADAARVNPRKRSRREEADPSSRHLPVPKRRQEGGNSQLHYTGSATSRRPIEVISLIDSDDDELKPLNNRRDHHSMPAAPPTHVPLPENNASTDVVPISEPVLCKEQRDLVDLITSGQNVFYTGSAGCGKSTVLKAFVKIFTASGKKVNIIAPTGRAALDINGSTTWTYMGWTPDSHKKPLKKLREGAHGKFHDRESSFRADERGDEGGKR